MRYNHDYELSINEIGPEGPTTVRVFDNYATRAEALKHADEKVLLPGQYFQIVKSSKDGNRIFKYWIIQKKNRRE